MKTLHWGAINPATGQPYTWDDPNLRWGDPAYILEPGDPGYTAPDPPLSSPAAPKPKRHKHMPKSDYLKNNDADFAAQLETFRLNIATYKTTFGLSDQQISDQAADSACFGQIVTTQDICAKCSQQWTAWRDLIREGGTPPAAGAPGPAVFPAPVPAVAPGIEGRFRALVKSIKAHKNYNTGIGEILGIEGEHHSGPDYSVLKPQLSLEQRGGQVFIRWGWQGYRDFLDMIEIQVDRGGGFTVLAFDTTPDYTDTTPLPATPAKWTYKAIFRNDDQRAGQWSDEVSITVG